MNYTNNRGLVRKCDVTSMKQQSLHIFLGSTVDLAAMLSVSLVIGYGIDQLFGTKPWGMVIFSFLGGIVGLISTYKLFVKLLAEKKK